MRGVLLVAAATLLVSGCVHLASSRRAGPRREAYLRDQEELPPRIAEAIATGHVVVGMDRAQVKTVLGDPVKTAVFQTQDGMTEVWIYPAVRLHQGHMHASGTLYRLVFADGRLSVIEPL